MSNIKDHSFLSNKFNVFFSSIFNKMYHNIRENVLSKKIIYYLEKDMKELKQVPYGMSKSEIVNKIEEERWTMLSDTFQIIPESVKLYARRVIVSNTLIPDNITLWQDRIAIKDTILAAGCSIGNSIIDGATILGPCNIQFGVIIRGTTINCNVFLSSWIVCYAREISANTSIALKVFIDEMSAIGFGVVVEGVGAKFHNIPNDYFTDNIEEDDYTYIGYRSGVFSNATVTRAAKIGRWSVVGPNTVAYKNIPPYSYAYGTPIKIRHHDWFLNKKTEAEVHLIAANYVKRKCLEELTRGYEFRPIVFKEFDSLNDKIYFARVLLLWELLHDEGKMKASPFDPIFSWLTGDELKLKKDGYLCYKYNRYDVFKKYISKNGIMMHRMIIRELLRDIFVDIEEEEEEENRLVIEARLNKKKVDYFEQISGMVDFARTNEHNIRHRYTERLMREYKDDPLFIGNKKVW